MLPSVTFSVPAMLHGVTYRIRPPVAAGRFYPAHPALLSAILDGLLDSANPPRVSPKALVVPHAGLQFSGSVAATAYATLKPFRDQIKRVVLVGPSHHFKYDGLATSSANGFATPLGTVVVDRDGVVQAQSVLDVHVDDRVHQDEHSLELQLPFLQKVLGDFSFIPLAVGNTTPDRVAEVLNRLWGSQETLIVVSSDLSHYHRYPDAVQIDGETARMIGQRQWESLTSSHACGYRGIAGLLQVADARGLSVSTIDLRNSGDTAGGKHWVVGYGSFVVEQ